MKQLGSILNQPGHFEFGPLAVARLMTAGLSGIEAIKKLSAVRQCAQRLFLNGIPNEAQVLSFFVPGRIEVLGKHTDYAGGRSILCTVERGFTFLASPRKDSRIRISGIFDETPVEFPLDPNLIPDMSSWAGYPQTVARRIAQNFSSARTGADIAFTSDLPRASGMSSSSAIVVAMFLVFSSINALPTTPEYQANITSPEDLAGYCGTIENGQTFKSLPGDRGVGTFGGSEDHTAILLSKHNQLVQYTYCPVHQEQTIPFPSDHIFALASSGVIAEKTGAAMAGYNRASLLARAVLAISNAAANRSDPTLADAIHALGIPAIRQSLSASHHPDFSPKDLLDRFDQFAAESEQLVPAFATALQSADYPALGQIIDQSQSLSQTHLKNQVPQTIFLAQSARELGAPAASAFGAGFGGSVYALFPTKNAKDFLAAWQSQYTQQFPEDASRATFFLTRPGPAAFSF